MRFIVDANMVFSGILNTNGKIGDLLINSKAYFDFIAPDFLRSEIRNHYTKLVKISGLTIEQVQEAEFQLYKGIVFISEEQIKISHWIAAETLVADIDPKDTHYIAYSKQFRCKIWSGDKALIKGLSKKDLPVLLRQMTCINCVKKNVARRKVYPTVGLLLWSMSPSLFCKELCG